MKTKTKKPTTKKAQKPYVIVRSRDAGVHAGYLQKVEGANVTLTNATRIWYWKGAATLSELAVYGAKSPSECKFGVKVSTITILNACEIISTEPAGAKMIQDTPPWRA